MGIRQEAEALFFTTGVQDLYSHWRSAVPPKESMFVRHGDWKTGEAPDFWAYRIRIVNPFDTERLLEKVVTYSVLYTAAEKISEDEGKAGQPFSPASKETGRACDDWIYSDSLSKFDPFTLDEVLQTAVYGGIWHPHFDSGK